MGPLGHLMMVALFFGLSSCACTLSCMLSLFFFALFFKVLLFYQRFTVHPYYLPSFVKRCTHNFFSSLFYFFILLFIFVVNATITVPVACYNEPTVVVNVTASGNPTNEYYIDVSGKKGKKGERKGRKKE